MPEPLTGLYRVTNQGKIIAETHWFLDAWLIAIFLPTYSYIDGPEAEDHWTINPRQTN